MNSISLRTGRRAAVLALALASSMGMAQPAGSTDRGYMPPDGLVPNAETAIAIAVAVWTPIYGARQIDAQRPFKASLVEGVWFVEGHLPPDMRGGVASARISKRNGQVLYVMHGK